MEPQSSIFVEELTAAKNYQDYILEPAVKPINDILFAVIEVIGFCSRIPLQITRAGQLSSDCKRTFQSSSLLNP
ncbi:unnamed protein product [Nezara viridula]|uniref:Uncharacterized protein n=1 Tax=Nezara viridula TaxID=85310 RepID=A0A9P0HHQ7_NEZVI|nr:unnamed protein product [Nezara viridula]